MATDKKKLAPTRKPVAKKITETKQPKGIAYLIESELEKAEVTLAVKAIMDKIQGYAEDVAKIEADEIMPMLDSIKTTFGPQSADAFSKNATAAVRAATEALKKSRDAISNEVSRMEGTISGEGPANDMAMDTGADAGMSDDLGADDMGGDDFGMDDAGMDADMGGDDLAADADADAMSDDLGGDDMGDEQGDIIGTDTGAAGRAKKESVQLAHIKALRESKNPDALIVGSFKRRLREGRKPADAARHVADLFYIDLADVIDIIRDSARGPLAEAKKRKIAEEGGFGHAKDKKMSRKMADWERRRLSVLDKKVMDPDFDADDDDDKDVERMAGIPRRGSMHMGMHEEKKAKGKKPDADKDGKPDWADKNPFKKGGDEDRKVAESKKKKPDADKDGIPNWADKKPFKKGGKEDRKVAKAK